MPIQPPIQVPAEDTPQPRRRTGSLRSVAAVVLAVAACALLAATATPVAAASVHGDRGPNAGTDHRCAGDVYGPAVDTARSATDGDCTRESRPADHDARADAREEKRDETRETSGGDHSTPPPTQPPQPIPSPPVVVPPPPAAPAAAVVHHARVNRPVRLAVAVHAAAAPAAPRAVEGLHATAPVITPAPDILPPVAILPEELPAGAPGSSPWSLLPAGAFVAAILLGGTVLLARRRQ